jgi:hypothetical protein
MSKEKNKEAIAPLATYRVIVPIAMQPKRAAAVIDVSVDYLKKLVALGKLAGPISTEDIGGVKLFDAARLAADWQKFYEERAKAGGNEWDEVLK